jgi:PAS domain S-box-containing protein
VAETHKGKPPTGRWNKVLESSFGRPWRIRRLLYAAAGALLTVIAVVDGRPRAFVVLGLAVGGVLTSLGHDEDEPSSIRLGIMAGYDVATAAVLAAFGMQYSSLLIHVGAVAAISLLRPAWVRVLSPIGGAVGALLAFLTLRVANVDVVVPADIAGEWFTLFVPMAALALVSAGMAWLFASVGLRVSEVASAQSRLERGLDLRPAPTFVVDNDRIVHANPAAIVFVGSALVGESWTELFGLEPLPEPGEEIRTIVASAGDARVAIVASVDAITFDSRPMLQVTVTDLTDVGDHSRPLAAPRRLDLLFDRMPVAVYRSAPSGEVLAANPALASMLGLDDPSELLGTVERTQQHYQDRRGRADWVAMFAETDVVMDYEMELTRADGTTITVTDSARAVRDRDGGILFFEGVLVDVTSRREAEEARRRISDILEATSDLVWLTDSSDHIDRLNASMRRFLADTEGAGVIGVHVGEFIVDGADSDSLKAWREVPDGPLVWRGELILRSHSGQEVLTSTVAQRHHNFISVIARDITLERRTARQLEGLMAAKDEFIASVSHELRTPLTAVVGLASELAGFYDDIDDLTKRDFIALVADQASEVAAIVEDLLVAARADTDSITLIHEEVDLRKAVDAVMAALPVGKRESFDVTGSGVACGDGQRIRQIVRNLITNAIRYGELPGSVTVAGEGDSVTIAVADKGPGIAPEMVDLIFQPYERATGVVTQPNSVGLGLSVSRWLAEKMGGSLVYENTDMSTFVLRLPAQPCP